MSVTALAVYERFEVVVALVLRAVIGIIIVVALYRLIAGVVDTILLRALKKSSSPISSRSRPPSFSASRPCPCRWA